MNIFEKLLRIQQEARVTKDMHNDFGRFNYRNAEMIFEALKPICLKYGAVLRVTDDVEEKCGRPYIKAIAELIDIETQGEIYAISSVGWARIPDQKKGMDDSQLTGSTSSYARKYALNGLFLLDDTKDADTDEYHNQTAYQQANNKPTITSEQVGKLKVEMLRTGATEQYICEYYKLNKLIDMTQEQYVNTMEMFRKTPDKK